VKNRTRSKPNQNDLTHRLRIAASPTLLLLDPEGRIAVVDRWPSDLLRGEQLLRTLQAKLPLP
jgi:hypothetical protein